MFYSLGDREVQKRGNCWVAESASIIGSVVLEDKSSVWFNAVLRGDMDVIHVGEGTNIQDGSTLHTDKGIPLIIKDHVTVGHQVMLHGCNIGSETLIGMKSCILDNAKIGNNCLIGANTLITEGKKIPDGSLVIGSPGKVVRKLTKEEVLRIRASAQHYIANSINYSMHLNPKC